jgi:uncharacterized membrane protein
MPRKLCRFGLVGAAAIALSVSAAAAPLYDLVGIGHLPMEKDPPDLNASYAVDVNDAGVVVGQSTTSIGAIPQLATGDFHAVRFTQAGGLVDLGDLALGGDTSAANAINASGAIAGRAETLAGLPPDDGTRAVLWSPIQDISGGAQSEATAINDLGSVAGVTGGSGSQTGFVWTSGGGMTPLPAPAGALQVFVEDLNDSDAVAGYATLATGTRACLWNAISTPLDLGDLDGDGGDSFAYAISDSGWIVGSSDDGGQQRAFRRDPGTGTLEGLPFLTGGDFASARDVNASGVIVGTAWDPVALAFHAVLWEADGTVHDLHDLIFGGVSGWTLEQALAISDTGYIAGVATNPDGEQEGFLLVPIPEPGSAALLLGGLALLTARRRRTETTR